MKILVLIGLIFQFNKELYGQEMIDFIIIEKDSLKDKTESEKAFYLYNKSTTIGHPDSAFQMASLAISFAKKCDCSNLLMASYFTTAYHAYYKGDYKTSLDLQLKADSIAMADRTYNFFYQSNAMLGSIYRTMGEKPKAIEHYEKSKFIAIAENDSARIGDALNNLGGLYVEFGDTIKGVKAFENAIEIYNELGVRGISLFNVTRGLCSSISNSERAKIYLDQAKELSLELNHIYYYALYLTDEGYYNERFENYPLAEKAYQETFNLSIENNFPDLQSYASGALGQLYKKLNRLDEAVVFFDFYFKNENTLIDNKPEILSDLSNVMAGKNNYQKAYYYADLALELSDSLHKIKDAELFLKYDNRIELLTREDEISRQELELSRQNLVISNEKSNFYVLTIIAVSAVAVLIGLFQWFYYSQRKKKREVELRLNKEKEFNDLRTTFLENIAHEIRTPITLINGHLDLALEKLKEGSGSESYIQQAKKSSNKVLTNANEILELLKLGKGQLPVKSEEISVNSFLKRIFYSFESLAEIKQVKLVYKSTIDQVIGVRSDSNRIEKVVSNFVSNAIKFSPKKGTVTFLALLNEDVIHIAVKDEGPGIGPGEHKRIFDRFYQSSITKTEGGIGVGLSIAEEFSASLRGKVSVENNKENGATFRFEFKAEIFELTPVDEQENVTPFNRKNGEVINSLSLDNKPAVLIVEDNPEMNAYLVEVLSTDYNCESVFNGVEGLKKVQTKKYGLIVSDIMMPFMDGVEFKTKINTLEHCKMIPFLFISAKARVQDRIVGYDLGIDDYIIKPFVKDELLVRISNLLSTKKERDLWLKDNLEFLEIQGNVDEQLLDKIKSVVISNVDNIDFKVVNLAQEIGYSQRQLSRFLNKQIGLSPVQYILEIRLKKAHLYLVEKKFATLNEVRNSVGISSASHFNKKFIERFGIKPSEVS